LARAGQSNRRRAGTGSAAPQRATRPPLWPAGMAAGNRATFGPRVGLSSHGSPAKGGPKSKCLARVKIARTSAGPPSFGPVPLSPINIGPGPVPLTPTVPLSPILSRFVPLLSGPVPLSPIQSTMRCRSEATKSQRCAVGKRLAIRCRSARILLYRWRRVGSPAIIPERDVRGTNTPAPISIWRCSEVGFVCIVRCTSRDASLQPDATCNQSLLAALAASALDARRSDRHQHGSLSLYGRNDHGHQAHHRSGSSRLPR
jgi:hypothetical protein